MQTSWSLRKQMFKSLEFARQSINEFNEMYGM